jgi:hypothetical protein
VYDFYLKILQYPGYKFIDFSKTVKMLINIFQTSDERTAVRGHVVFIFSLRLWLIAEIEKKKSMPFIASAIDQQLLP